VELGGPKEPSVTWGPDDPPLEDNFEGNGAAYCKIQGLCALSCAGTTEPIEMSFGMWTRVGPRKHLMECGSVIHWRHLANAVELSVCGGDAALSQLTFTTCTSLIT